jgi:hypothetical protein
MLDDRFRQGKFILKLKQPAWSGGAYPHTNPVPSPRPQKPRGMKKFVSLFSPEMMLVCRVVTNLSNTILHTFKTQN